MTKLRLLSAVYLALSITGLLGCWSQNLLYFPTGFFQFNVNFWGDTWATPGARSILIDLLVFSTAFSIWMVGEAKRLQIKWVWAYMVFGLLTAVAFTFPLFLYVRQRKLMLQSAQAQ
jgi:hypothetical protein